MKKLFGIGVVVMFATVATLATVATRTSHADPEVAPEEWSCNTTCRDTQGFVYVRVSYGGTADQAYQNLSCQAGDTIAGEINCWPNQ